MADEENDTTQTTAPDATETPEAAAEATPQAPEPVDEATSEEAVAPAPVARPAGNATTRREARESAQTAQRSKRPSRTPEERQADRAEARRAKAAARSRRRGQEREKARAGRTEVPPTPPATPPSPGAPKVRAGRVVSDKPDKTITVRIESARRHRRYEKVIRSSATLHAHDESNDANEGDLVRVIESRPTSRTKRWRLVEVLERAE